MNVQWSFFEGVFALFHGISGAHLSVGLLIFGVVVLLLPLVVFALIPPDGAALQPGSRQPSAKVALRREPPVAAPAVVPVAAQAGVAAGSAAGLQAGVPTGAHAQQRILVVDDSAVVRAKLAKLLKTGGWNVDVATDGLQALAMLEKAFYAVLITDLEMPRMNGAELIAHVQGAQETEDLPVIAITGHDEFMARVRDFQGLFGLYKKPWNDRELLQRVSTVCHLRQRPGTHGAKVLRDAAVLA